MQALVLMMLLAATTAEFFATGDAWGRWAVLPRISKYLPEIVGAVAFVIVAFAGPASRFKYVRPAYWLVFGSLLFTMLCGALINSVDFGPIVAGIRNYFRSVAWFLVPMVVAFSSKQLRTQLLAVLAIAVLQVPFAFQQRLTTSALGRISGDYTSGTLLGSGVLSIFLVCVTCVVIAMMVRNRLGRLQGIGLIALLLLPTMINETKASLILLPVGVLFAAVVAQRAGKRTGAVLRILGFLALFIALFTPVYDYYRGENRIHLDEFFGDPERIQTYLYKKDELGTQAQMGRVDSIVVPLRQLASEPWSLMFGYGIGNVSDSALGAHFVGRYFSLYDPFLVTSVARIMLELGVAGVVLILLLVWLILSDCIRVAKYGEDIFGALAAGWVGVSIVITMSLLYAEIISVTSLSFLFWYFAGVIAAERMRLAVDPQRIRCGDLPDLLPSVEPRQGSLGPVKQIT